MHRLISSVFAVVLGVAAWGMSIHVNLEAPGTLASFVDEPAEVTTLAVAGPMDASDFYFIARNMSGLTTLDLSAATVAQYKGATLEGRSQFDAGIIPSGVLAGSSIASLTLPTAEGLTVGQGAFAMTQIKNLTVGANVAEVGDAAFALCPELAEVTVAAPEVGAGAFADCPKLAKVTFTAPVVLDNSAFARDEALKTVSGAELITAIGPKAFVGCSALADFNFGSALTAVGERAFSFAGLMEANLAKCASTLAVGDWAFAEMPALQRIDLSGAASLGDGVVFNDPVLASFTAPASDSIAAYTFALSTALPSEALLPDGVRVVGAHALHGLSAVAEITIPASVEHISDGAMAGMTGLTTVTTEATEVPSLGQDVWKGVNQPEVTLVVPAGYGPDYEGADQWKEFNIYDVAGIDDIAFDASSEALPGLRGRFAGAELQVSIGGDIAIERLSLHHINGMLLLAVEPFESLVTIDTADMQGRVFIISALLSDGRRASLKLAR